jgi:hypothetical protein
LAPTLEAGSTIDAATVTLTVEVLAPVVFVGLVASDVIIVTVYRERSWTGTYRQRLTTIPAYREPVLMPTYRPKVTT